MVSIHTNVLGSRYKIVHTVQLPDQIDILPGTVDSNCATDLAHGQPCEELGSFKHDRARAGRVKSGTWTLGCMQFICDNGCLARGILGCTKGSLRA